jgi:hypothetical protein
MKIEKMLHKKAISLEALQRRGAGKHFAGNVWLGSQL